MLTHSARDEAAGHRRGARLPTVFRITDLPDAHDSISRNPADTSAARSAESIHDEIGRLREEVAELLADAILVAEATRIETERVNQQTLDETARVQALHHEDLAWIGRLHDDDVRDLEHALESRDLIGQAKGITMVAMRCGSEKAFELLRDQSQHANRTLVEVAAEVVARAEARASA